MISCVAAVYALLVRYDLLFNQPLVWCKAKLRETKIANYVLTMFATVTTTQNYWKISSDIFWK